MVARFSPRALSFAAVVVVAGGIAAWIHVGTIDNFFHTPYGLTLFRKLVFVVLVIILGGYHERIARHRLDAAASVTALRRTASAEIVFSAVILLFTAILTGTSPAR
jgi:putative copper export protein